MRYVTYVLKSGINGDIYIGSTRNLENRIQRHNDGKVKSTKGYKPWGLMEHFTFPTRAEAMRYEKFLKTGQQKEILRKKYGHVVK